MQKVRLKYVAWVALLAGVSACSAGAAPSRAIRDAPGIDGSRWVARRPPPPLEQAHRLGDYWVGSVPREDGHFNEIAALDAESYAVRWRYRFDGSALSLAWVVSSPEVLVAQIESNRDAHIVALDPRSGRVVWQQDGYGFSALIVEGVLVTDHAGSLTGRRARDGGALWTRDLSSNMFAAGGPWLVAGTNEAIEVLDPQSGGTLRRVPIATSRHQDYFAIEGNTLYVTRWGGGIGLVAADLATGAVSWTSPVLDTEVAIGAPRLGRDHVFACTTSNVIIGWDKRTGARWFTRGVIGCYDFTVRPGQPEELSLSKGGDEPMLEIRAAPNVPAVNSASIEGTVTDTHNRPVGDAEIGIGISKARSDARGHYHVDVDFPGTVCASAEKENVASRWTCIEPSRVGANRLDLLLERRTDVDD